MHERESLLYICNFNLRELHHSQVKFHTRRQLRISRELFILRSIKFILGGWDILAARWSRAFSLRSIWLINGLGGTSSFILFKFHVYRGPVSIDHDKLHLRVAAEFLRVQWGEDLFKWRVKSKWWWEDRSILMILFKRKDFRVIKSEWLWKRIEEEDITELLVSDDRLNNGSSICEELMDNYDWFFLRNFVIWSSFYVRFMKNDENTRNTSNNTNIKYL